MKTEINSENKAKFFAQYMFQRVLMWHEKSIQYSVDGSDLDIVSTKRNEYILELKPLSSITDEDSEVFRLIMHWPAKGNSVAQTIVLLNDQMFPAIAIDFLRSKGYAVSWMGLSVNEMVRVGWVKLKEGCTNGL